MSMEELYEFMRKALKFFDLSFDQKNRISVSTIKRLDGIFIRFQYEKTAIEFWTQPRY